MTITALGARPAGRYATLEAHPVAGALGAEITGVDLAAPLDDQQVADIAAAASEHLVIFFRDQDLPLERQEALTRQLGGFGETPFVEQVQGHDGVVRVVKEADETAIGNFGGGWHTDWSFQPAPPSFTLLYATDVPPYGGDTLWANMHLAYETLSPGLQETLAPLRAVHSARRSYAPGSHLDQTRDRRSMRITAHDTAYEEQVHPLVTVHPVTGRRTLFLNPTYTIRIDGWTPEESEPLLGFLQRHATAEVFTCRFRWTPRTLALWDNRGTQHNALNDYDGFRREAWRTTVAGAPPQPVQPAAPRSTSVAS